MDAVEDRFEFVFPEHPQILQQRINGNFSGLSHWNRDQQGLIHRQNSLSFSKTFYHLPEIARQLSLPTKRIHAVAK